MSWLPLRADHWAEWRKAAVEIPIAKIPGRLWMASLVLRAIFIISLVVLIVHVGMPQSAIFWTSYDPVSDFLRMTVGLVACVGLTYQLFVLPKDAEAYRTWLYLGATAVPFLIICIVGVW